MRPGKASQLSMYLILIPDEKAQCPQSSIDLFYIEVEGVQLHQPEADKILAIMNEDSDKKKEGKITILQHSSSWSSLMFLITRAQLTVKL